MRAFVAADVEFVFHLATSAPTAERWRFAGRTPRQSAFVSALERGVSAHWIFTSNDGSRVGYSCLYHYDPVDGVAYFAIVLVPEIWQSLSSFDCMVMAVDYIFAHWDIRSLYAELTELTFASIASGSGEWYQEVGRLRAHQFQGDRYVDSILIEVPRDLWRSKIERYRSLLAYKDAD